MYVAFVLVFALLALSGCSVFTDQTTTDGSVRSAPEPTEEAHPAGAVKPSHDVVSEDVDTFTLEDAQLIYYGEVLAHRYGIDVSPDEWLSVTEKECESYRADGSTRVHGPAAAEELYDDPRSGLLIESFVFLVIGSQWCGYDQSSARIQRYGQDAQLISLAFMATVIDNETLDLSVAEFSNYFDDQLFIVQQEYDAPAAPDYSNPSEPDINDPYENSGPAEDGTTKYGDSDPGSFDEYEGNSGGPTLCKHGTVSQSSGSGTCSWHGGEY